MNGAIHPAADSPVVLITGASGGLGRALTGEFLSRHWKVAAACHSSLPFEANEELWPFRMDVTDTASVAHWTGRMLSRWGRIDLLINNAGLTADGLFWRLSEGEFDKVVAVNLKGAAICSRAVLGPMCARCNGQIINISSYAARAGHSGQANYVAAKAGLIGLTQSLAREVGSRNVRVNAVLPGILPTEMTGALSSGQLNRLAASNVLGRINSLDEVARFVCFLAGTGNISGQVFQLDSRIASWT